MVLIDKDASDKLKVLSLIISATAYLDLEFTSTCSTVCDSVAFHLR